MRRAMVAVLAAMFVVGCADRVAPLQSDGPDPLWAAYNRSIRLAAVKSPDAVRPLRTITDDEVTVAHVQTYDRIDQRYDVWVALPDELRPHCAGKPDPVRALQMALGLPPKDQPTLKVFTFKVRRTDIFRPCASSASVEERSCTLDVVFPSDQEHREFVLKQIMASYRTKDGYPFTAMGWSYNWDPAAKTPMGVSEYVLRRHAVLRDVTTATAAQFCAP